MSGYKRIPKEIKDEVLARLKQGQRVPQLASEYGISSKTDLQLVISRGL